MILGTLNSIVKKHTQGSVESKTVIRVYLGDSVDYEILPINENTTAKEACDCLVEKLSANIKNKEVIAEYTYALYESIKNKETQLEDSTQLYTVWNKRVRKEKNAKLKFKSPKGNPLPREATVITLSAIQSPIDYITKSLRDLLLDELVVSNPKIQNDLKSLLTVITTTQNLYNASFHKLANLDNEVVDNVTKSWLYTEYAGQRERTRGTNSSTMSRMDREDKQKDFHQIALATSVSSIPRTPVGSQSAKITSWEFNVFKYKENDLLPLAASMFYHFGLMDKYKISQQKLTQFLITVKVSYNNNPYHNFYHAFDVLQTVFCILVTMNGGKYLSSMDLFSLLVAALCHDIGHPGVNNAFMINVIHPYALTYNDRAVLENLHCFLSHKILMKPENNILEGLSREELREFRKIFNNSVMSTDMANHFPFLTKFNQRLSSGKPLEKDIDEDRDIIVQLFMKCADISNIAKPWDYSELWADRITQENFAQGDQERELKLPVAPFMDRTINNPGRNTANFIDYVAKPLFDAFENFLPDISTITHHIKLNRKKWEEIGNKIAALAAAAAPPPPPPLPPLPPVVGKTGN